MAIDNRLRVYDEQGNPVDYDILASDVKFLPDGKDLPTKLDEMQGEIDQAGQGDGTVTGVKVGNTPYDPDGQGVVDLSTPFAGKVDKETGKSLMTDAERTKLQNLPTADQLSQQMGKKANDADVVKSISVNGQAPAATPDQNGNVNINVQGGGQVTVTTNNDGTFTIHSGDNDYTVNLNHTHENMAKLIVCEESDLPSTLDEDTIYGVNEDGEIAMLYVGGLPFYGGGGGDTSTPVLRQPADGSTIDVGKIASGESSVTKTITVKGKNLTQALTVAITGTGYSVNKQSISAADANVGTTLTITCTNTDTNAEGTISIGSSEVSCDCNLVANKPEYDVLAGVKLTGTQWLQTNYYPNAKTEFTMKVKFTSKGNSFDSNHAYFMTCANNTSSDGEKFQLYHTGLNNIVICNKTSAYYNGSSSDVQLVLASAADFVLDDSILSYTKGTTQGTIAFIPGGDNSKKSTHATSLKTVPMQNPVRIGRGNAYLYEQHELTIKELTFTEDGVTVQHWVPRSLNGVAGLLDTENGTFITSEVEGQPLVAVPLSNN